MDGDEVQDLEAVNKVGETDGSGMIIVLLLRNLYIFLAHMAQLRGYDQSIYNVSI